MIWTERAENDLTQSAKVNDDLERRIHLANVRVHRQEAAIYDSIHSEIFNKREQKRIREVLIRVDQLIDYNGKLALDFGAGTGNLTGKLLDLGYEVTAVDISKEMCDILRKKYEVLRAMGKLKVINAHEHDLQFEKQFDLVSCYSVLHHLPNYVDVVARLTACVKTGGVVYLDHEMSPLYWSTRQAFRKIRWLSHKSDTLLTYAHNSLTGKSAPSLDYRLADYWVTEEHHISHDKIYALFQKQGFRYFVREDYALQHTWIFNPISGVFRLILGPDVSLWIAKK